MARITNAVKTFMVRSLAWGDSQAHVARAVKDEFDLALTKQQVAFYDPRVSKELGKQWKDLFKSELAKSQTALDELPLAGVAARVRMRSRMAASLEHKGNALGANAILADIARDVGGLYTNRRELTGKDGEALVPQRNLADMSTEELAQLAQQLAQPASTRPQ